ncbi:MAG: methyltransferase domain-containing protein [Solirubrobacterales bacterium]|nr:methyltransferase domain-containing protein [Solirubrobacterales bacterium]
MDLDQYREKSLESWNRFSANWDEESEYLWSVTGAVGERLVQRLDPQPGETILELAAGTGRTGFAVAERVGDEGRVISTDFAPGMVEVARRRGKELGLDNLEHRVLDAEAMELDDASVDGVVCRWGYMLMADPAAALAETRRVLRDGGRLSFAVWGPPDKNMWAFLPGLVLVELGYMDPPEPGAPGIFAMGDPDRIRGLVTGAGFAEPTIEQVAVEWGYPDTEEHWEKTLKLAAPIAEAVNALTPEEQARVRATVRERVAPLLAGDGAGINGLTHVVLAE